MARLDLNALAARIRAAVQRQLETEAELILGEADRIVPIEEGTLSRSGKVSASGMQAQIGYGSGAAAPYAVKQHEDLTLRHDAGRSGKYLEQPFMAAKDDVARGLADAARKEIR